jgi:hypothetical protein
MIALLYVTVGNSACREEILLQFGSEGVFKVHNLFDLI